MLLDMSIYAYLLFGIPLTAGFQLFVRKRPIKDLWVRGGPGFSLRSVSLKVAILAILLAIYPFYQLVQLVVSGVSGQGLDSILYALAAIVGAGAAYALEQFRRETWRYLGLCLATAGLLGVLLIIGPLVLAARYDPATALATGGSLEPVALFGIEQLLLFIPVVFMMEEVAFRGAIDSHVRHPGERHGVGSTVYGVVSAIVVSVLWGLWHYPVTPLPHASVIEHVALVAYLEVAVGPFLSFSLSSGAGRGTSWCPASCTPRSTQYETPSGERPRDRLLEERGDYPKEEGQYDISNEHRVSITV
jgi:membrane protease YdiL (CAAX protease family)